VDNESLARGTVKVHTRVFPLAFLLFLFRTNISIDENVVTAPWGMSDYQVNPGRHRVSVGFRYFFGRNMGGATIDVDVGAGQAVLVSYRSPFVVFSPGEISVAEV
jgi:hypothetical protein